MSDRECEIRNAIIELLVRLVKPERIVLFGSRAKGTNTMSADFDFAVSGSCPDSVVEKELHDAIEASIGLYSCDVVYLNEVDDSFRAIIESTGEVVYDARDETCN